MVENFNNLYGKNIVLLQGPVGYFFQELEDLLISNNNFVFRFIFNSGDDYFSKSNNKIVFNDSLDYWNDYLENFLISKNIDTVIMYGDKRVLHKISLDLCNTLGIESFVFEQGYLRPNFITFEKRGVNFSSKTIPKNIEIIKKIEFENNYKLNIEKEGVNIDYIYYYTLKFSFIYCFLNFLNLGKFDNPYINDNYHFRFIIDGFRYLNRKFLKLIFKRKWDNIIERTFNDLHLKYFFIPLQLSNDTKVTFDSEFSNMTEYLNKIIVSFSKFSDKEDYLIIKAHPLDIEFKSYNKYISELSDKYKIKKRIIYMLDGDVCSLIKNSKGVVTINSTVGISSLYHLKPVKPMGDSVYSLPELTNDKELDLFWSNPEIPELQLVSNFLNYVLYYTQLPGSFYIPNNIVK